MLKRLVIAGACMFSLFSAAEENMAVIYPSVLDSGRNLLKNKSWLFKKRSDQTTEFKKSASGSFAGKSSLYIKQKSGKRPAYWNTRVILNGGRRYLLAVWIRNLGTKSIVWLRNNKRGQEKFDIRLYYYSGVNSYLKDYVPSGKSSTGWELIYRTFDTPPKYDKIHLTLGLGIYFSEGEIYYSQPQIIDITETKDLSLTMNIDSKEKVDSVSIFECNTHDVVFEKKYTPAIKTIKIKIPGTSFMHGLEKKNTIESYGLKVKTVDGRQKLFYSPVKGIFKKRQ